MLNVTVVYGPPGSGKTTVAQSLSILLSARGETVLRENPARLSDLPAILCGHRKDAVMKRVEVHVIIEITTLGPVNEFDAFLFSEADYAWTVGTRQAKRR